MSEPVSKLICAISSLADIGFSTTTVACDSKRAIPYWTTVQLALRQFYANFPHTKSAAHVSTISLLENDYGRTISTRCPCATSAEVHAIRPFRVNVPGSGPRRLAQTHRRDKVA